MQSIFRLWIPKRCKGVHCVDLGESFPTSIYLQNLALIQPRAIRSKFADTTNYPPSLGLKYRSGHLIALTVVGIARAEILVALAVRSHGADLRGDLHLRPRRGACVELRRHGSARSLSQYGTITDVMSFLNR